MENIISIENQKIKRLKKLSQKKYRKDYSSFLVENYVIIRDSLLAGVELENLFITESFFKKNLDKVQLLKQKVGEDKIFLVSEKINNFLSSLETSSGIFAEYKIVEKKLSDKSSIYLNGVSDPGNLGTIFRTCLAFGFENIICDDKCADIYNHKTISAAKDSIFKLNILKDINFSLLKNNFNNIPVFTAEASVGESVSTFSFPEKYFLVFGSESHGIDKEILNLSNNNLRIKISKNIESLNVSSAVAIFLYEINRK